MIAELDAILKAEVPIVFVVDDNLIGNKKAIKAVLRDVIAWQERHNYPLSSSPRRRSTWPMTPS